MKLFVVRHPIIEKKFVGTFIGSTNVNLSSEGKKHAERIGKHLRSRIKGEKTLLYTSDLKRAQQTAKQIKKYVPSTIRVSELIREINFGSWETRTWANVIKEAGGKKPERSPDGESYKHFTSRVTRFIQKVVADDTYEAVIIVTSAGVNRELLRFFIKNPIEVFIVQDYGCINILEYDKGAGCDGEVKVKGINILV